MNEHMKLRELNLKAYLLGIEVGEKFEASDDDRAFFRKLRDGDDSEFDFDSKNESHTVFDALIHAWKPELMNLAPLRNSIIASRECEKRGFALGFVDGVIGI